MSISQDLTFLDPQGNESTQVCELMNLEAASQFISSPDTGNSLMMDKERKIFFNESETFPIFDKLPILFPKKCHAFLTENTLEFPLKIYEDPFLQYMLLGYIKQKSDINNLPANDLWAQRHYHRAKVFMQDMTGNVLDVGCDNIKVSQKIFPASVEYLGLDVGYTNKTDFRIIGMGEFLPFKNSSFDNVTFMTSLDHIFDYHRAINEAFRVLKPGGTLYIAALVWQDNADLHHDLVHFHHFREFEILGALQSFELKNIERYNWKQASHRHAIYISAKKNG